MQGKVPSKSVVNFGASRSVIGKRTHVEANRGDDDQSVSNELQALVLDNHDMDDEEDEEEDKKEDKEEEKYLAVQPEPKRQALMKDLVERIP